MRRAGDKPRESALAGASSELRLLKDPFEISELEHAIAVTGRGFAECVRELPAATGHGSRRTLDRRHVLATRAARRQRRRLRIDRRRPALTRRRCTGCATTAASKAGDLALLDMGVEVDSFYTADVTRTLPIDGRFRDIQRQVYDVVLAAQQAGIDATKPGRRLPRPAPGRHGGHRRSARGLGPASGVGGRIAPGGRRPAPALHAAQHLAHAGAGRA